MCGSVRSPMGGKEIHTGNLSDCLHLSSLIARPLGFLCGKKKKSCKALNITKCYLNNLCPWNVLF